MPRLKALAASGPSGRQFLRETLQELEKKGYLRSGAAGEDDWSSLISAAGTGGLFDEKRVTVVEGAEKLGPFPDSLDALLDGEDGGNILLLVYETSPAKIFKPEIRKKVDFLKPETLSVPPWKRKEWVSSLARRMGASIAGDAAAILGEMIDDSGELRSELEKLAQYADGEPITEEMVRQLSFDEGAGRMLAFLDGFCLGRFGEVIGRLDGMKKEESVLPAVTALYNRIRPALYLSLFPNKGGDWVGLVLQIKDYPLRMSREALRRYPAKSLTELSLGLLALSWKEKTALAEGWLGFEALVARCMGRSGEK
ncbi:MAG: DNA polymerase III subunit delta [Aminivibrio sp.]|jgi:DNA polymerase III delta subunit